MGPIFFTIGLTIKIKKNADNKQTRKKGYLNEKKTIHLVKYIKKTHELIRKQCYCR